MRKEEIQNNQENQDRRRQIKEKKGQEPSGSSSGLEVNLNLENVVRKLSNGV